MAGISETNESGDVSNRGTLALFSITAPLAWVGLAYTIFNINPDGALNRILFFALFYVAMLGTFSLGAYFLSFRLFASKMYRGNASRSSQQGLVLATFVLVASLLQVTRALSVMTALILLAALAVAGFVILSRK